MMQGMSGIKPDPRGHDLPHAFGSGVGWALRPTSDSAAEPSTARSHWRRLNAGSEMDLGTRIVMQGMSGIKPDPRGYDLPHAFGSGVGRALRPTSDSAAEPSTARSHWMRLNAGSEMDFGTRTGMQGMSGIKPDPRQSGGSGFWVRYLTFLKPNLT